MAYFYAFLAFPIVLGAHRVFKPSTIATKRAKNACALALQLALGTKRKTQNWSTFHPFWLQNGSTLRVSGPHRVPKRPCKKRPKNQYTSLPITKHAEASNKHFTDAYRPYLWRWLQLGLQTLIVGTPMVPCSDPRFRAWSLARVGRRVDT